jgi:subtilase-type proteinase RRT12
VLTIDKHNTAQYYYTTVGQENVDVYIIDTGIYAEHPEFEGRVKHGIDLTGEGPGDMNGHGKYQ